MAGIAGEPVIAVRLAVDDDVATLLAPVAAGGAVAVRDNRTGAVDPHPLTAAGGIPRGHKIALRAVAADDLVHKYGLPIGRATADIAAGEHVHLHNLAGLTDRPPAAAATAAAPRPRRMAASTFRATVEACLRVAGAKPEAARAMAEALLEAHLRGVETHGVRRLRPYVERLRAGGVDGRAEPRIETRGGVLRVDGRNGLGHYVAAVAADAVAKVAARQGVAVALVRRSNHFGFAGYYATRIAAQGQAAVVASNGQVLVGPEGGLRPLFSNDPIAVAAPLPDGTFFEFDAATSVTSRARIVAAAERGETIAEDVALDAEGRPTTDAARAAEGILLPFGGAKGFGLITAIEMLAGVLGGGAYADLVASKEDDAAAPEGTAHFLLAIDLESACGRDLFGERLADLNRRIATLPVRPGAPAPRHPGARRWRLRAERLAAGLPLTEAEDERLRALAGELGVTVAP